MAAILLVWPNVCCLLFLEIYAYIYTANYTTTRAWSCRVWWYVYWCPTGLMGCVCADFSGEEVIGSWKEVGSLVQLGFPLSDHRLHMGLNHQPAFSQSGWGPRMQELLGGTLGDFLSEGSSHSRNVSRPQSRNKRCPCRRWRSKACGGINAALLPSSEDAGRMELIAAAQS